MLYIRPPKDEIDSLLSVSVPFLESLNATVKVFEPDSLSHLNGSSDELLLGDLDTLAVWRDFHLNCKLLAEAASRRAFDAKVDLSDFKASRQAIVSQGLEL